MATNCGSCLLQPTLKTGHIYYLKFEVEAWHGDELFFGVTTNTDPGGKWLDTDAGWFLRKSRQNCSLTNLHFAHDSAWDGWQQGDRPLFKVDLVHNILSVVLARPQRLLKHQVPINLADVSSSAVFFCVTMGSEQPDLVRVVPIPPGEEQRDW